MRRRCRQRSSSHCTTSCSESTSEPRIAMIQVEPVLRAVTVAVRMPTGTMLTIVESRTTKVATGVVLRG